MISSSTRNGERVNFIDKATVDAGTIVPGNSTASLSIPGQIELLGLVEQAAVVGRLGLHIILLNMRVTGLTSGATAYWVSAAAPKPFSSMAVLGMTLPPLKVAGGFIITKEFTRTADPRAEPQLRADLTRAASEEIDRTFLDPSNAGVADERPASVTNGVTPIASADSPSEDIAALISAFTGDLASASFVTDPVTAAQIALARDAGGGFLFPDAGPRGGSILGLPLVVSRASPRDSSGGQLVLLDGTGIVYGSLGVKTEVSEQAAIAMSDDPDSPAEMVSLFQTNSF